MRFLKNVGKHGLLGLCIVIGTTVCSNTREMSRADTERDATAPAMESMPIGCRPRTRHQAWRHMRMDDRGR